MSDDHGVIEPLWLVSDQCECGKPHGQDENCPKCRGFIEECKADAELHRKICDDLGLCKECDGTTLVGSAVQLTNGDKVVGAALVDSRCKACACATCKGTGKSGGALPPDAIRSKIDLRCPVCGGAGATGKAKQ